MADEFDINDRSTWDWVGGVVTNDLPGVENDYYLNPADKGSFYQRAPDGAPIFMPCPTGMIFNPWDRVCDHPSQITEAKIYDWAVSKGVVNDQR